MPVLIFLFLLVMNRSDIKLTLIKKVAAVAGYLHANDDIPR